MSMVCEPLRFWADYADWPCARVAKLSASAHANRIAGKTEGLDVEMAFLSAVAVDGFCGTDDAQTLIHSDLSLAHGLTLGY